MDIIVDVDIALDRYNRALEEYVLARTAIANILDSADIDKEIRIKLEDAITDARDQLYLCDFAESELSTYNKFIKKINKVLSYIRNVFSYVFHHIDDYSRIIGQITIAITATASMIAALHGL